MSVNSWKVLDRRTVEINEQTYGNDECAYVVIEHALSTHFDLTSSERPAGECVDDMMAFIRELNPQRFDDVRRHIRIRELCRNGVPPEVATQIMKDEEATNCNA